MGSNELLEILSLVTYFAHAMFSNLLLGGMPILVLSDWLGRKKGKEHLRDLAHKMGAVGGKVLMLTLTVGLFSWFLQWMKHKQAFMPMMEAVSAPGWGLLVFLILLVSWGLHLEKSKITWFNQHLLARMIIRGLTFGGIVGMTFFFVVAQTMILNPSHAEDSLQHGVMAWVDLQTVWPRFFHMALGALAGTGVAMAVYGTLRTCQDKEGADRELNAGGPYDINITRYGIGWALAGTLPQIAVGPWLLLTLPQGVRDGLLDGGTLSSLVFFLSLTFALVALVLLNAALMVPQARGLVWSGLGSLVLTLALMVIVRGEARKAWLHAQLETKTVEELSVWVVLSVIMTIFGGLGVLGRFLTFGRSHHSPLQLG